MNRKRVFAVMAAGLMVAAGSAGAQPQPNYIVQDSAGHTLGPLSSSDSISQGAVIRIRTADQTICGGDDNDCEDPFYLLIPWNSETPGYPTSGEYQSDNGGQGTYLMDMPPIMEYFTDSECLTQPYIAASSKTNSEAKPYNVVGGQGGDGIVYYPGSPVQTAQELGIVATELVPFGVYQYGALEPSFEAGSYCQAAWVAPSELFAPMESLDISATALEQAGFEPPYALLDDDAANRKK